MDRKYCANGYYAWQYQHARYHQKYQTGQPHHRGDVALVFGHFTIQGLRSGIGRLGLRLVAAAALNYPVNTPASFGLQKLDLQPEWMPATPYIVFFHGTAGESKKWPRNNWIGTARDLQVTGWSILLPWGSEAERIEAEAMAEHMSNARVLPKLSMQEATVLAQRAALAIGVDTGLVHIAAAYETPTIELYCDSPKWKTEGNWSEKIINLGDQGRPPSVAEVEIAFERLLSKLSND